MGGTFSFPLAEYSKTFITSYVVDCDVIPRYRHIVCIIYITAKSVAHVHVYMQGNSEELDTPDRFNDPTNEILPNSKS